MTENKRFDWNLIGIYDFEKEEYIITYPELCDELNKLHEEKEHCKKLYEQMAYYFRDDLQLFNLDHKDFQALKRLSRGEYDD